MAWLIQRPHYVSDDLMYGGNIQGGRKFAYSKPNKMGSACNALVRMVSFSDDGHRSSASAKVSWGLVEDAEPSTTTLRAGTRSPIAVWPFYRAFYGAVWPFSVWPSYIPPTTLGCSN